MTKNKIDDANVQHINSGSQGKYRKLYFLGIVFISILHFAMLFWSIGYEDGYGFPIYVIFCQLVTIVMRSYTTSWISRAFTGELISDEKSYYSQELPWIPSIIVQFWFGVGTMIDGVASGKFDTFVMFLAYFIFILFFGMCVFEYFRRARL